MFVPLLSYARSPVAEAAEAADASFGLLVVDASLAGTFVMGWESLVFGLLPIRFLEGEPLWAWSRRCWFALCTTAVLGFVLVLVDRRTGRLLWDDPASWMHALGLFVAFAIASALFWAYFRWMRPAPQPLFGSRATGDPVQ